MGALLLGLILGMVIGYTIMSRRKTSKYLATAEYWVYIADERMPEQREVMDRMLARNPYVKGGRNPIGPAEGLIFSDVRLHMALVLRSKNPHVFRPDLFDTGVDPTAEMLKELAEARALIRIRYTSEEPLPDRRHLQFLPHAVDACADLTGSRIIYDSTAERLILRPEISQWLAEDLDATRPDFHIRVQWQRSVQGGHAETRGLAKIGGPELRSAEVEGDERILVTEVMAQAARTIWSAPALPNSVEVTAFQDTFRVLIQPARNGFADVRILRIQGT